MDQPGADYAAAFKQQVKKYRWYARGALALVLVTLIVPFILLAMDVSRETFGYFLAGVLVPIVLLVVPIWKMNTCPACRKFMGRDVGSFCPVCGVRIRG